MKYFMIFNIIVSLLFSLKSFSTDFHYCLGFIASASGWMTALYLLKKLEKLNVLPFD